MYDLYLYNFNSFYFISFRFNSVLFLLLLYFISCFFAVLCLEQWRKQKKKVKENFRFNGFEHLVVVQNVDCSHALIHPIHIVHAYIAFVQRHHRFVTKHHRHPRHQHHLRLHHRFHRWWWHTFWLRTLCVLLRGSTKNWNQLHLADWSCTHARCTPVPKIYSLHANIERYCCLIW